MIRFSRSLPIALVLALLLAAALAGPGHQGTPLAAADAPAVTIADYAFQPATLTVSPGQTVTWTNTDGEDHNVMATDHSFASPLVSQGQTFSFTFSQPGTYTYECTIHPWMKATIVVADTGAAAPSPAAQTPPPTGGASGSYSPTFTLGGAVGSPATYALSDLQALPAQTLNAQFSSGQGQQQHTYVGVLLYNLLMAAAPKFNPSQKNDKLNWYVRITAIDGYQAVVAWGEIDPAFEGKNILVAYEKDGPPMGQGDGMAELVVPGDAAGGRYVSSITSITLSPAAS